MLTEVKCANIVVRFNQNKEDLAKAQKLRYEMLLLEYNKNQNQSNDVCDYDNYCDHLIAIDENNGQVVGTYRLMRSSMLERLDAPKQFISEREFDLTNIKKLGAEALELSRAVVHKDYRDGLVLKLLWRALFLYCEEYSVKYLFGTTSFRGTEKSLYKHAFSYLFSRYRVSESLDCPAVGENKFSLDMLTQNEIDIALATKQIPSLVKGYCMLGSLIGSQAYVDVQFNSMDILTVLELEKRNHRYVDRIINR